MSTPLPFLRLLGTLLLAAGLVVQASQQAAAHKFAPALLELRETVPPRISVRWKEPAIGVPGASRLRPVLPPSCSGIGTPSIARAVTGIEAVWAIACPGGLVGKTIGVEGVETSGTDVLVRVELADGRSIRQILNGQRASLTVPASQSAGEVFGTYVRLGVEHVLSGVDHLLFVFGLTLLVRDRRLLLWTITAFTAGHSVTLALAVLDVVTLPQALVESAIAFSIYLLAVELARGRRGGEGLWGRPWLMAGLFGLLHGLGFASALMDAGLPADAIPLTLFSFNVGIEVGQLAFVAAVLVAMAALPRLSLSWPWLMRRAPAYVIGSLAAFWFLERSWSAVAPVG